MKYGEPRWHDAAIGGGLLVKKKAGKGSVEVLTNGNDVFYFLSVFGVLSLFNGTTKVKYRRRQKMTRPVVFLMAATAIIKTVSFSAQTALVANILMHGMETHPGPNCSGVSSFVRCNTLACLPLLTSGLMPWCGRTGFQASLVIQVVLDP